MKKTHGLSVDFTLLIKEKKGEERKEKKMNSLCFSVLSCFRLHTEQHHFFVPNSVHKQLQLHLPLRATSILSLFLRLSTVTNSAPLTFLPTLPSVATAERCHTNSVPPSPPAPCFNSPLKDARRYLLECISKHPLLLLKPFCPACPSFSVAFSPPHYHGPSYSDEFQIERGAGLLISSVKILCAGQCGHQCVH